MTSPDTPQAAGTAGDGGVESASGTEATPGGRRGRLVGVLLAVVGGLVLASSVSSDWVRQETTRTVAGVEVPEVTTISGAEFAGAAIAAGLAALLGAVALAVTRGRARRVAAIVVGLIGVAGTAVAAAGAVSAWSAPGDLTPAPGFAVLGGVAVAAGAASALRRPSAPPALGARYTVEGEDADDEWRLASDEDD